MRRSAAGILLFAGLCSAPAGGAATARFEVHLRVVPILADAGQAVRIRLTVYSLATRMRTLSDRWSFRVVALTPTAARIPVRLQHLARGRWSGAIRVRTVGTWRVRIADWPGTGSGPTVQVKVREPTPPTTTPTP